MIQPLFDKNQIFMNLYNMQKSSNSLVSKNTLQNEITSFNIMYLCKALGVDYDVFMEEYENFKKSIDI